MGMLPAIKMLREGLLTGIIKRLQTNNNSSLQKNSHFLVKLSLALQIRERSELPVNIPYSARISTVNVKTPQQITLTLTIFVEHGGYMISVVTHTLHAWMV